MCLAALCDGGTRIVCIADRLWTFGDISHEPAVTKLAELTDSVVALVAGDSAVQTTVLREMYPEMEASKGRNWSTLDLANLYSRAWWRVRDASAEAAVLRPKLIDRDTFTQKQPTLDPHFIERTEKELTDYSLPRVDTIIAGIDARWEAEDVVRLRARLFVVDNDWRYTDYPGVRCEDGRGHAAIGIGASQALTYLALAGHTRHWSLAQTLLTVYGAKKHSEHARYVGEATDMWMLSLDGRLDVTDTVVAHLEEAHKHIEAATKKATAEIMEALERAVKAADAAEEEADKEGREHGDDETPDSGGISGGPTKGKPKG
jgi:hypothetical protein